MKKRILSIAFLAFALVLAQSSFSTSFAGPIILKYGAVENPKHKFYPASVQFAKDVEAMTNGAVKVELYFSGQLGNAVELIEAIQVGTVDITVQASKIGRLEPMFEVFDLPYLFSDEASARKVKKGVRLLAYWELGFRQIVNSKRPIVVPADLKGLKLRTPNNRLRIKLFESFGSSVSVTSLTELYLALKQGVLDGCEQPLGTIVSNKFYEVAPYLSLSGHVFTPGYLLIREESWKKIPQKHQKAILKAAERSQVTARKLSDDESKNYVGNLKEKGMKVNDIDKESFVKAVKPFWEKEGKKFGDLPKRISSAS
jgi:tripartite ATP-independent transporter DctP family solute receptor